jgi:hypothetical protein
LTQPLKFTNAPVTNTSAKTQTNISMFVLIPYLTYKAGYDTRRATGYPETNYSIDLGYDGLRSEFF